MKIKIITGFRQEQHYTIDAEEAHKAYYLFYHPEERGVFNNGVALVGKNIQGIEPDYHSTMGWNPNHTLTGEDWNEIRGRGVDVKIRDTLSLAREVARIRPKENMMLPLSEAAGDLLKLPENKKLLSELK